MRKLTSKATPIGISLNIILIINVCIVLYPVLFTISSSFTKSNSLAATSVIPFTTQIDKEIKTTCEVCKGTGIVGDYVKPEAQVDEFGLEIETVIPEENICKDCDGRGYTSRVSHKFAFKKPSIYQYQRLLTSPDKLVKGETSVHGTNYKIWYFNTLKIAVMNTLITVFVCTLAGYIFSRFEFTGRKQIMGGMIVLQMFPSFIGMVATYVILWKFNALNTLWGLVLVYSAGSIPFNSQLMKGYFDTMSKDIAEAAYIDGAGHFNKNENGEKISYTFSNYNQPGERRIHWYVDGVIKYHRTFSDIINALSKAGFIIEEVCEPVPEEWVIEKVPAWIKEYIKPNFLIVRARKDAVVCKREKTID